MKNIKNNLTLKIIFLMLMTDVLESVGELFFKQGVSATGTDHVALQNCLIFFTKLVGQPTLWFGVLAYALNFILWLAVLSRIDLSVAFPIGNATYIIIPFLSMIVLHEKITLLRWIGIACIIIGVTLISRSTESEQKIL